MARNDFLNAQDDLAAAFKAEADLDTAYVTASEAHDAAEAEVRRLRQENAPQADIQAAWQRVYSAAARMNQLVGDLETAKNKRIAASDTVTSARARYERECGGPNNTHSTEIFQKSPTFIYG